MTKLTLLTFSVYLSLNSCAQEINQNNVPAVVVTSFQQHFEKASDVEWKKKGNLYEVEFETGVLRSDHEVCIDSLGVIVSHRQDLAESDLPEQVKAVVSQNFPGFRIEDIEKMEKGKTVYYELELEKRFEEWKVIISQEGKILEKAAD